MAGKIVSAVTFLCWSGRKNQAQ